MNLLLIYFDVKPVDTDEARRFDNALASWMLLCDLELFYKCPVHLSDFTRSSSTLGDPRPVPYVHDLFDYGCKWPADIVVYINRDIGLTTNAHTSIVDAVTRNKGATAAFRRNLTPEPGRSYANLRDYPLDGGFDLMAFTPDWWNANKHKMPDMVIGREAWDNCFCCLVDEHVHGKMFRPIDGIWNNPAYLDNAIWHEPHKPYWVQERLTNPGNLLNLRLAIEFFTERGNEDMLALLKTGDGSVVPAC